MSHKVLVFAEVREGKLKGTASEILSECIRQANGATIDAVLLGAGTKEHAAELAKFGANTVHVVESESVSRYQSEYYTQAVSKIAKDGGYTVIVGPASPTGRDFFPRLSVRL